ncbi:hypothetical protein CPB85DRAFT_1460091 [Mucidula mucida]|nr:hypothetical protein CPB85DRAFT_1460091 [Mucidula mucida]
MWILYYFKKQTTVIKIAGGKRRNAFCCATRYRQTFGSRAVRGGDAHLRMTLLTPFRHDTPSKNCTALLYHFEQRRIRLAGDYSRVWGGAACGMPYMENNISGCIQCTFRKGPFTAFNGRFLRAVSIDAVQHAQKGGRIDAKGPGPLGKFYCIENRHSAPTQYRRSALNVHVWDAPTFIRWSSFNHPWPILTGVSIHHARPPVTIQHTRHNGRRARSWNAYPEVCVLEGPLHHACYQPANISATIPGTTTLGDSHALHAKPEAVAAGSAA